LAIADLIELVRLIPALQATPHAQLTVSYDEGADVMYVNLRKGKATDSELTDDDVIIRYEGTEIIGYTVLHASKRAA
jgi:uncharacterized protein YuzE